MDEDGAVDVDNPSPSSSPRSLMAPSFSLVVAPSKEGEVYSPEVNCILMILCVLVILIFGDGKDIGNAFGIVVSLVMLITTILLTLVMIMI
ncbi:hypothetical protein VitviT2T_026570 [Vitis vinifera]|uniref:K+ potassium transporter integral membrane domain-containing protein n=1 Tax=Vitis vinifera TaxID=29760 RepID=A0ABY9DP21_VITVI|nr:hypothetical protein VitviT2T_026570 [Vitis vinifera]